MPRDDYIAGIRILTEGGPQAKALGEQVKATVAAVTQSQKEMADATRGTETALTRIVAPVVAVQGAMMALAGASALVEQPMRALGSILASGMRAEGTIEQMTALLGSVDAAHQRLRFLEEQSRTLDFSLPSIEQASEQLELFGLDVEGLLPRIGRAADLIGRDLTEVVSALSMATLKQTRGLKKFAIDVEEVQRRAGVSLEEGADLTREQMKRVVDAIVMGWDTGLKDADDTIEDRLTHIRNSFERFKRDLFEGGFGDAVGESLDRAQARLDEFEASGTLNRLGAMVGKILSAAGDAVAGLVERLDISIRLAQGSAIVLRDLFSIALKLADIDIHPGGGGAASQYATPIGPPAPQGMRVAAENAHVALTDSEKEFQKRLREITDLGFSDRAAREVLAYSAAEDKFRKHIAVMEQLQKAGRAAPPPTQAEIDRVFGARAQGIEGADFRARVAAPPAITWPSMGALEGKNPVEILDAGMEKQQDAIALLESMGASSDEATDAYVRLGDTGVKVYALLAQAGAAAFGRLSREMEKYFRYQKTSTDLLKVVFKAFYGEVEAMALDAIAGELRAEANKYLLKAVAAAKTLNPMAALYLAAAAGLNVGAGVMSGGAGAIRARADETEMAGTQALTSPEQPQRQREIGGRAMQIGSEVRAPTILSINVTYQVVGGVQLYGRDGPAEFAEMLVEPLNRLYEAKRFAWT